MTVLDDIRAAIVATVAPAASPGSVHDYERYAAKVDMLRALYVPAGAGGVINGWHLRRGAIRRRPLPSGRTLVAAEWGIVGYRSLVDAAASERALDGTADAIIAALATDPTLSGLVRGLPVDDRAGPQLLDSEPVMFGGVLCHRVRIGLWTEHFEGVSDGLGDGLGALFDPAWRLITATCERLSGLSDLAAVEGRLDWDRDDDPPELPAAIVVPVWERASADLTTDSFRDRVDIGLGVVIVAPAHFPAGEGAAAADGLGRLRRLVGERLHGWGDGPDGPVEIPLAFRGAGPVPAPVGRVAWREIYAPSIYVEAS